MPAPTTQFRNIPVSTTSDSLDSEAERKVSITGESTVSTTAGQEWDFGSVDISGGSTNSPVKMLFWNVTNNGGNTLVDSFKVWIPTSTWGFDSAGTTLYISGVGDGTTSCGLSFDDVGTPSFTQTYVSGATTGTYTWRPMDVSASQPTTSNIFTAGDTSSLDISSVPTEVVSFAAYLHVDANESVGIFKGTDSGYEFQGSFKFDYS